MRSSPANPTECKMVAANELFLGQYQSGSQRLPDWDYAVPGWYFITICTKDRQPFFGEVVNGEMIQNELEEIAEEEIQKTETIRDNVAIDSWIVMPDHVHLIIMIEDEENVETPRRGVSTEPQKHWKPGCLGSIINQFKGACTRRIRVQYNPSFAWQSRYYDHIIRTETDLDNLREYIHLNPERMLAHV